MDRSEVILTVQDVWDEQVNISSLLLKLVRVMVLNATFNNSSVISWWRKPEYPEKTTDLPQVTDKLKIVEVTYSPYI